MSINVSTTQAICNLLNNDPSLLNELSNKSTKPDFINKQVKAAHANGIVVDEAIMTSELDRALSQFAESGELSDE